jgi:hypothetical protein
MKDIAIKKRDVGALRAKKGFKGVCDKTIS